MPKHPGGYSRPYSSARETPWEPIPAFSSTFDSIDPYYEDTTQALREAFAKFT